MLRVLYLKYLRNARKTSGKILLLKFSTNVFIITSVVRALSGVSRELVISR